MRRGRTLLRLVTLAILLALAWVAGLIWFAERVTQLEPVAGETDAIVVLTGGSERIAEGVQLLAQGQARLLFVSGVPQGVDLGAVLDGAGAGASGLARRIVLGHSATDTATNAAETAAWAAASGVSSLRLVTANYHMPRSLIEFRRAMPQAVILPHPISPARFKGREWWRWPGTLALMVTEYDKYLIAAARGALARATGAS